MYDSPRRHPLRTATLWFCSLLVVGFVIATPKHASAQTSDLTAFQVQQFRPWADPLGAFDTPSGRTLGQWGYTIGLMFNYSKDPLILRTTNGERIPGNEIIEHQIAADLNFGIGLFSWLDIYLSLPLTLYQIGSMPERPDLFNSLAGTDISGFYLSDLKIGLKLGILSEDRDHGASLALKLYVGVPTSVGGSQKNFNGEDGIAFGAKLLFSKEFGESVGLMAHVGYRYMPVNEFVNLALEHELRYSLAFVFHLSKSFDLIADVGGGAELSKVQTYSAPLDIYFGARIFAAGGDLAINIGGGLPFLPGYGSPQFRVFLGLTWAPRDRDRDKDGILDRNDKCPDDPGPKENQGCPWGDKDGDGLKDNVDKCPDQAGPQENQGCPWGDKDNDGIKDNEDKCPDNPGPKENQGCPFGDKDGDGIKDNEDQCPEQAGPKENNGCPWPDRDKDGILDKDDKCPDNPGPKKYEGCPDRDGDGVIDKDDQCPDVPGLKDHPKGKVGCPKVVLVVKKKGKIEILQKIFFKTASAKIRSISFPVLDQVAQVMNSNPKIRVKVEGHTDDRGSARYNKKLSDRRSKSVREYLINKGISGDRLEAEGFGEDRPLVPNRGRKNRAKNRRVEFNILTANSGVQGSSPDTADAK